jgi:hypothetical protein
MEVANTLAYYDLATITAVKLFEYRPLRGGWCGVIGHLILKIFNKKWFIKLPNLGSEIPVKVPLGM